MAAWGVPMKGAKELLELRKQGIKPASVCLMDYEFDTDWLKWGELPRITVHKDKISDIDLRFVVGMTVMIESYNQDRADHLFEKCIGSGASIVAASIHPKPEDDPFNKVKSINRFYFKNVSQV
jgi:hypothetical protein